MKKNLFAALTLVATFGLGSCSLRESSSVSSSTSTSSSTPSAIVSSSTSSFSDPLAVTISGLDLTKATNHTVTNNGVTTPDASSLSNGYVDGANAYGWVEYTAYGSKYGVAIKLTVVDNKIANIVIGVPEDGVHNFTPMYAESTGASEAKTYLATFVTNVNAALMNKSVLEIASAFKNAAVDPDASTFTPVSDGRFVGAGATQTDSRTDVAVFEACYAYVIKNSDSFDPFHTVFTDITGIDTANIPTTGAITGSGLRKGATTVYGWSIYSAYSSSYAAALKLTVDSSAVITAVELGLPIAGAHNFTPRYIMTGIDTFYKYCSTAQSTLNAALVGKTINAALATTYGTAVIDLTAKTFTPAVTFIGAGATQTDSRINLAILGAINTFLAD
jgi:hypothetical protein